MAHLDINQKHAMNGTMCHLSAMNGTLGILSPMFDRP